jgi:putative CocE/NonD family hydrolase
MSVQAWSAVTFLFLLMTAQGKAGKVADEVYSVVVDRDVMIGMRDGLRLAADIYRPVRSGESAIGKFPTILIRTTYNKDNSRRQLNHEYFVKRGYVVVIQDVRGRYKSEGQHYHGVAEMADGYDTIEWIAQQAWSDGKIGMTGISYLAAVQSAAAVANPPHLASLFHVKAPANYYQNGFRHAGTFLMYSVPIAFMLASSSKEALQDQLLARAVTDTDLWRKASPWLAKMPLKRGLTPLSLEPQAERWFFDMMTHTDYTDFWKKVALWQPEEYFPQYKDVPSQYVGGWYDLYREETFYTGLVKRKKGPVRLIMGPWTHTDFERFAGDVDFGPEAALSDDDYNSLQLAWFDRTLRGRPATGEEPPVKIFVMGGGDGRRDQAGRLKHGGRWRLENEWPLARTRFTNYYFHDDGSLRATEPSNQPPSIYVYDPKDPVPTIGGSSYFLSGITGGNRTDLHKPYVPYGAFDQRERLEFFGCRSSVPLSARHDVLVFQTPPLTEDVEVTGPLMVQLWASSSAVDTDFTAKLIDVHPPNEDYPEGYAMNLSDSILRARYREGFEKPVLMKPGETYKFNIDMPPTSNVFKKGHRIRVDISSSNYPTYDPNPNTGDPYTMNGRTVRAENAIYHDRRHPSHLTIPLIPAP